MIPVIINSSLRYANCFPFLISIQSCPSSIESSSPKVAATRLSYIRAASRSMLKSSSGVLEYLANVYYYYFLVSEISIQQSHVISITNTTISTTQFKETDQLVLLTTSAGLLGFKKTSSSILLVKTVEFTSFTSFSATTNHRKYIKMK
jgi:hypothetical protein